jgi:hypothetical protein
MSPSLTFLNRGIMRVRMRSPSFFPGRVLWVVLACVSLLGGSACDCGARPLEDDAGTGGSGGNAGGGTSGLGGGAQGGGGGSSNVDGGNDGGDNDAGCPDVACDGRCGPIRDFCRGTVLECGSCSADAGFVCNLATSQCTPVEVSCGDLGAQCGQIRNSCGKRLNCGACGDAGLECDRNTNTCVTCTNPSCQDLGYQCGSVWLGCGPFSNVSDCGSCDGGNVCNSASHICEPGCTPGSAATLCAAAGAQCGFITDGCGGQVDCGGCDAGTSCGARGIGNVCDPPEYPDECIAANRNCGPYTSACGGPTLDCGTCTAPDVCSPNGRCGPPCTPTACTDMMLMGKCGTAINDGCQGTITCGCGGGLNCTMSAAGVIGDCVPDNTCATYGATGDAGAPCSNGQSSAFPKTMTQNLACPCATGGLCNNPGTTALAPPGDKGACCFNTASCLPGECNTTKINPCTGATITCSCTMGGTHCDNSTNTCIMNNGCQMFTNGNAGKPCSNGPSPSFPNGAGGNLTCPCSAPGAQCFNNMMQLPNGSMTAGTCCVPDTCPANFCGTVMDHCTGTTIQCGCGANQFCAGTACMSDLTCNDYSANGAVGAVCSNGPSFPTGSLSDGGAATDGGGVLLTCPCNGAEVCTSGTTQVTGATRGMCCLNTAACGNMCNTQVTNSCTGAVTQCGCAGNNYCSSSNDAGMCLPFDTCANYMANGLNGQDCSTTPNSAFPRFPGDMTGLTCPCTGGRTCSAGGMAVTAGELGMCCTNSNTCGTSCNTSVTNSCTGQVTACNCGANSYCSSSSGPGTCMPDFTCSMYTSGLDGQNCSTNANVAFPRFPSDPTGQTCACAGGRVCSKNGMTAGAGVEGTCCTNTAVCNNTCNTSVTNTCTGASIACSCGAGNHCSSSAGAGTCVPDATCATYMATGQVGKPCSTGPDSAFHDGPNGMNLTCNCTTGGGFANNTCTGSSMSVAGTCSCTPSTPQNCGDNGKSDGCGGTMSSTCAGNQVCYQNACCNKPVCPAGAAGDQCGVIMACGLSTSSCPCTAMYQSCGAVTAGICGCKAKTLADCGCSTPGCLPAGQTSPDGCGGFVNCPN